MKSMTATRPPIPYDIRARVFFRDKWLCWLCGKPVIFGPALKLVKRFIERNGYLRPTAYFSDSAGGPGRRDASPLLDELGALLDHVKAHSAGGGIDEANLKAACARCNMRKSNKDKNSFSAANPKWKVKSKYGEPEHWDGFVSMFMVLARANLKELTSTELQWYRAFDRLISSEAAKSREGVQ